MSLKCWCGSEALEAFSRDYARCSTCGTLVTAHDLQADLGHVQVDEQDFYGREYWFSHQEQDLAQPNVESRARTDLPERCLHWLRTVLKYQLPPGRVLELGSAHGGFVAMLRWAGFDAAGLELSPAIVDYARRTFDVPMYTGPVEDQTLSPESFDAIVLMDVLEHLPDPLGTMTESVRLLKPGGVLIIQTPHYVEDRSYERMLEEDDRFLEQLKADEHLYLFSERSVRMLLSRAGAHSLAMEPAIFPHYDMFLVAGKSDLVEHTPAEVGSALAASPGGRLVQALLDLRDQVDDLQRRLTEAEADREARLRTIEALDRQLQDSEADRAGRLRTIERLDRQLEECEADRAARLDAMERLGAQLAESEADRAARLEAMNALGQQLQECEADRAARLNVIERLTRRLEKK